MIKLDWIGDSVRTALIPGSDAYFQAEPQQYSKWNVFHIKGITRILIIKEAVDFKVVACACLGFLSRQERTQ